MLFLHWCSERNQRCRVSSLAAQYLQVNWFHHKSNNAVRNWCLSRESFIYRSLCRILKVVMYYLFTYHGWRGWIVGIALRQVMGQRRDVHKERVLWSSILIFAIQMLATGVWVHHWWGGVSLAATLFSSCHGRNWWGTQAIPTGWEEISIRGDTATWDTGRGYLPRK